MESVEKTILNSSLFGGLLNGDLNDITKIAVTRDVRKGKNIFFEGDESLGFYVVARGKVKIFKLSIHGKEKILHILGDGEPFGEAAVFSNSKFPANAAAINNTRLLFFPRRDFIELVSKKPSLALNMLATLSLRLKRFAAQIEQLTLKEAPGRLAAYLLHLCQDQGDQSLKLNISKGQLASLLGTASETLSRILNKMSAEGYLTVRGRNISILNFSALEELAEQGGFTENASL